MFWGGEGCDICKNNCRTCQGNGTECLTCWTGQLLHNGGCVNECPVGYESVDNKTCTVAASQSVNNNEDLGNPCESPQTGGICSKCSLKNSKSFGKSHTINYSNGSYLKVVKPSDMSFSDRSYFGGAIKVKAPVGESKVDLQFGSKLNYFKSCLYDLEKTSKGFEGVNVIAFNGSTPIRNIRT